MDVLLTEDVADAVVLLIEDVADVVVFLAEVDADAGLLVDCCELTGRLPGGICLDVIICLPFYVM